MKLTTFFIEHPVIAAVLNIMIVIIGLMCLKNLSMREYPNVNLPAFSIHANYPNASAELVESSVTNILEDQLGGVEGVETMTSQSRQGGCYVDLVFLEGTSIERALIAVREAINLARSNLSKEVRDPVIQRKGQSDGPPFIEITLSSPNLSFGKLTHYAALYLKNAFRSLKGVASAEIWGQPYTMTVSLDPKKMYAFGVNVDEIFKALEESNNSWPVGKFRGEVPATLDLNLSSIEDFDNLIVKGNKGKSIFLKSLGNVELRTDDKQFRIRINGKPGLVIAIAKTSDANPLDVSRDVHRQVENLQKTLPKDIQMEVDLDQTDFIKSSLRNIQFSIIEAILLVLAIVFLFLGSVRSTVIPLITIPVSLTGSVILMQVFGCSINTITLLAMVLAIGLVVDDAIVVLENITRYIEKGLSPLEAAIIGSREIGFAIIAMTLTLASVYAPIAFIKGTVGQLFIEFAITLAGSVLISGIVALTLSPMMCGKILNRNTHLWPKINQYLKNFDTAYARGLTQSLAHPKIIIGISIATFLGTLFFFYDLPRETAPKEDRGQMGVYFPTIPGEDINTLEQRVVKVEERLKLIPEAKSSLTFMGEWGANICISLKPHNERSRSAAKIVEVIGPEMKALPSMDAYPWGWDSGLPGIDDNMNGSELTLAISTVGSYRELFDFITKARKTIEDKNIFSSVHHNLNFDNPGYMLHLDTHTSSHLGISPFQVAKIIEVFFSGDHSLLFQKDGIRYPIELKGSTNPWTLNEPYLTNKKGKRISLGTIAELRPSSVPKQLFHHNQMHAAYLTASLHLNQKIESAMAQFWALTTPYIPQNFKREWIGAAKVYEKSSTTMLFLFAMALIFIYAILAIQFENFIDPVIIMLTIPLGCFGALFTVWIFGQSLNIYSQIGLITLIGLITKHGILIVEFSNKLQKSGHTVEEAVKEASTLRLRPILMTTSAMVVGTLPLILSAGAGAEARRSIGFVLIGGLFFGTGFTLFILPTLYHLIKSARHTFPFKLKTSS
jgi:multidrug efflux pump